MSALSVSWACRHTLNDTRVRCKVAKKAIIATSLKVCLRVTDRHFEHLLHSKWLTCHYWPTLNVCMFSPPCSVWSSMSNQQWRLQSPVSALTWRRIQVCLSHRLHLVRWQRAVPVQLHGQPGFIYWIYFWLWKCGIFIRPQQMFITQIFAPGGFLVGTRHVHMGVVAKNVKFMGSLTWNTNVVSALLVEAF